MFLNILLAGCKISWSLLDGDDMSDASFGDLCKVPASLKLRYSTGVGQIGRRTPTHTTTRDR
jgi:hypothetical protein